MDRLIRKSMLAHINAHAKETEFCAADFVNLSRSMGQVEKTLTTLVKEGKITRVRFGIYKASELSKLKTLRKQAVLTRCQTSEKPTGEQAAVLLGLLPHKITQSALGCVTITKKETVNLILKALPYLRRTQLICKKSTIALLRRSLTADDKRKLRDHIKIAPHWMGEVLDRLIARGKLSRKTRGEVADVFSNCPLCHFRGTQCLEKDHVYPRHVSLDDEEENILPLCDNCHRHRKPIISALFGIESLYRIRSLRIWWFREQELIRAYGRDSNFVAIASLLRKPQYQQFVIHCEGHKEVVKTFSSVIRLADMKHRISETDQMAIIEIRCFIAPVLDRCSELETAHYYFERIINTGKLLGLSNSDPILTNARTHLVHCLHKMQTVDGFQRAELMLNGEEGPLAVNQENMLNRLKRFHNRKEHDELLHCFNAVSSGLNSRELSIACELLGTSYIRNVVALCSGKYALSRSGVQQQLDEARHMLENSFALSIGDAMPRTTLIRSLHLVGLFALTVLPSLQYGGIPELAAQALICARAFSFGRTGVDEPSQACLEDCSILSDRVNKCVIERESIGSPLRQIEYLCGLKATLKPITDHGGPHISGWQLPFK